MKFGALALCSLEGPTLQTSVHIFQTFYGGKIEIINASVDKPNSCLCISHLHSSRETQLGVMIKVILSSIGYMLLPIDQKNDNNNNKNTVSAHLLKENEIVNYNVHTFLFYLFRNTRFNKSRKQKH